MRIQRPAMLAIIAAFVLASGASAAPITFIFTGLGDGYVGDYSTAFDDKPFTIRLFADTEDVRISPSPPGITVLKVEDFFSELSLEGYPTAKFTLPKQVFVNHTASVLGFGSTSLLFGDLLNIAHPDFSTYDLRRPFMPIFVAQPTHSGLVETTTIGRVELLQIHNVTFRSVVPEPSTIALSLCILGCFWTFGPSAGGRNLGRASLL
jgi:hypothetical protein